MIMLLLAALSAASMEGGNPARDEERRARGNVAQYVTNDDYPASALSRGAEGTVAFRLEVGPDGRVLDCSIAQSSGHPDLDGRTCEIMRERARFEPARDASGRAIRDTVDSRISWRIADDDIDMEEGASEPMRFASFRMASTFLSSGDGSISCRLELNGEASPAASGEACRAMLPYPDMELPSRPGSNLEFTVVAAFTPTGASPAAGARSDYGTLVGEAEAEITISQEGIIADCRLISVREAFAAVPNYCEVIAAEGGPGFETTKDQRPRTGRLRISAYTRVTTTT